MPILQGALETRADRVKDRHQELAEEGKLGVSNYVSRSRSRAPRLQMANEDGHGAIFRRLRSTQSATRSCSLRLLQAFYFASFVSSLLPPPKYFQHMIDEYGRTEGQRALNLRPMCHACCSSAACL